MKLALGRPGVETEFTVLESLRDEVDRHVPSWDHRPEEGLAKYCLVVSFEAVGAELPIYTLVSEAQVAIQVEVPVEVPVG